MLSRRLKFLLLAGFTTLICLVTSPVMSYQRLQSGPEPGAIASALVQTRDQASLSQRSRALYEAGRYVEAIPLLEQAIARYQAQNQKSEQAIALSNLSLAYQQLGQWQAADRSITQAFTLAQAEPGLPARLVAQLLNVRGQLQLAQGEANLALETWQQATTAFQQARDVAGATRTQLNQVQALRALGFYRRALDLLTALNQDLHTQPNTVVKAIALRSLGNALLLTGQLDRAAISLDQSLALAKQLQSQRDISAAWVSLGNLSRARSRALEGTERIASLDLALSRYQAAVDQAELGSDRLQIQANQLSLLAERADISAARLLWEQIQPTIAPLPAQKSTITTQINLARSLMAIAQLELSPAPKQTSAPPASPNWLAESAELLANAAIQARQLGNDRLESYAVGTLGTVYERAEQWQEAENLTRQALALAQTVRASEVEYRWQWQLGRLLKQQGEAAEAVTAYNAAVDILQSLRTDLVAMNPDVQFNFRDEVEPVYRQSVAALLALAETGDRPTQVKSLDQARQRIESLQLAELDNFFRQACLDVGKIALDTLVDEENPNTAILYPILLQNQLQVIVKLPQQPLKQHRVAQSQAQVSALVNQFRIDIIQPDRQLAVQRQAKQIYDWLIAPIAKDLEQSEVNTLVFVLDGPLRNLPMSVLYDGQQYLVEKYAIALNLGLQLPKPQTLMPDQFQVLTAGLITPPSGFENLAKLPAIASELNFIRETNIQTQTLLEREFTRQSLGTAISTQPFNIIHLATHGQFSSRAEDTFILAADGPINVTELDTLLRRRDVTRPEPIDLLVLSACTTAAGDDRATLGLAGIALRAGARSTLASLWQVDDQATALFVGQFYRQLASGKLTKAEALRQAQLAVRAISGYQEPGFWAPFILLGNWL